MLQGWLHKPDARDRSLSVAFTDQRDRLRRIVRSALDGATYDASHDEAGGRLLVIDARRPDGRGVHVRFRGVRSSEMSGWPAAGATLRLVGVGYSEGLLRRLLLGRGPVAIASRVSIDAGPSRLDIVCEDAEWWED